MACITKQSSRTEIKSTGAALQSSLPAGFSWDGGVSHGTQRSGAFVQTGAFPAKESTWTASQEAEFSSGLCQAFQAAASYVTCLRYFSVK